MLEIASLFWLFSVIIPESSLKPKGIERYLGFTSGFLGFPGFSRFPLFDTFPQISTVSRILNVYRNIYDS